MTAIQADQWEHGSEFHWFTYPVSSITPSPWSSEGNLFGSGRDALGSLLNYGRLARNWRRLWVPSYFCQEVLTYLKTSGIVLEVYPDGPTDVESSLDEIDWRTGDVILRVNFFGLRANPPPGRIPDEIEIIEDHTHDPWSAWAYKSTADWCVASLRKTLPLGNGGVVWSPAGHPLPEAASVTPERHTASLEKLAAMVLKAQYLSGFPIEKSVFRRLQLSGEEHIASGPISGMPQWAQALLSTFPIANWREHRAQNYKVLAAALAGIPWVSVLQTQFSADSCPFAGILVFDMPERKAEVRKRLIATEVFPAILWPLEDTVVSGIRDQDLDFSRCMLAIHCDMRYTVADMQKVASLIMHFGSVYDH